MVALYPCLPSGGWGRVSQHIYVQQGVCHPLKYSQLCVFPRCLRTICVNLFSCCKSQDNPSLVSNTETSQCPEAPRIDSFGESWNFGIYSGLIDHLLGVVPHMPGVSTTGGPAENSFVLFYQSINKSIYRFCFVMQSTENVQLKKKKKVIADVGP